MPPQWKKEMTELRKTHKGRSVGTRGKLAELELYGKGEGMPLGGDFWSDFGKGFVKGFTGTMKVGLPLVKALV